MHNILCMINLKDRHTLFDPSEGILYDLSLKLLHERKMKFYVKHAWARMVFLKQFHSEGFTFLPENWWARSHFKLKRKLSKGHNLMTSEAMMIGFNDRKVKTSDWNCFKNIMWAFAFFIYDGVLFSAFGSQVYRFPHPNFGAQNNLFNFFFSCISTIDMWKKKEEKKVKEEIVYQNVFMQIRNRSWKTSLFLLDFLRNLLQVIKWCN